ncbi:MAG TPA: glycosyltransferase family 9 protein [Edaphobacter sp.]
MSLLRSLKSAAFSGIAAIENGTGRNTVGQKQLNQVENFIVLQHASALGTAIHGTPVFAALKHAVPKANIAVVASGFSLDALRNNPNVDTLIATPSPLKDLKSSVRSLRQQFPFRRKSFVTLAPIGNERTLIVAQALLGGASTRVGFTVQPDLFRIPMTFDSTKSQIANNLRLVEALGYQAKHFEPKIFFTDQDAAFARNLLSTAGIEEGQPVVVFVTQTSVTQRKSWRPERFREAAIFLKERYGAHILFVGTGSEAAAIDELRGSFPFPTASAAGKTNLAQLTALMSLCTVGLTLDTGPLHIGRAAGLPMVIIAPAWSPVIEWLPVGNDRYRILKNGDMPSATPDYIIDEVSVAEVTSALDDLFLRFAAERLQPSAWKAR